MIKEARAERFHIGVFGNTNAGKSSFINYITQTDTAIVSEKKGTTTDPIYKAMEIHGFGPVVFIDTAGVDDFGDLGDLRVKKSRQVINKSDLILYLLSLEDDLEFIKEIKDKKILFLATKQDVDEGKLIAEKYKDLNPITIDINNKDDRYKVFDFIKNNYKFEDESLTKNLVKENDLVILVMPQDKEAPKARLIKPQVMMIRELIDKNCSVLSTNLENFPSSLEKLKNKPDLIITDSKVFKEVYKIIGDDIRLTSFSVLLSAQKGDIDYYIESVKVLDEKIENILIAEACTHPPTNEDIGTVKIPNMLRKKYPNLNIDFKRGDDFYDIEKYDLIIQCGSCMFNKEHVQNRLKLAKEKNIPMTNYGITIAYLQGILDKITI